MLMKRIVYTFLFSLFFTSSYCQLKKTIAYQSILRDNSNTLIVNKEINMKISVLQNTSIVYTELHNTTTNSNGLVTLKIGEGNNLVGDFSEIDWSKGGYFIKAEVAIEGDNNYAIALTSELQSVPYSFYADKAKNGINEEQSKAIEINSKKYSRIQVDSINTISKNSVLDSIKIINDVLNKHDVYITENNKKYTKFQVDSLFSNYKITFLDSLSKIKTDYLKSYIDLKDILDKIENETSLDEDYFATILPKKLFFSENKEFKIFTDNFIFESLEEKVSTKINFPNVNAIYQNGVFSGKPIASGNWHGNITVYDKLKLQNNKEYNYLSVGKEKNITQRNILFIGDSYTDRGDFIKYLKEDFEKEGVSLKLMGTMGKENNRHEALSGGRMGNFILSSIAASKIISVKNLMELPLTSYPGTYYIDSNEQKWAVRGYKIDENGNGKLRLSLFNRTKYDFIFPNIGTITKTESRPGLVLEGDETIEYTSSTDAYFNPFWNPSTEKLDFKYYIKFWDFEIPDIVVLKFGWNDLPIWASDEKISNVINNALKIFNQLHSDFPNTKIIFSIQGFGQVNNTKNRDVEGTFYTRLKFSKKLSEIFENKNSSYDFVYLAPTYAWIDPYNGYLSDAIHPNELGFRQIADCLYPIMLHIFNLD